ncbi:MAG: NAD+ synthase [Chitinophagales bacterium]
MKIAIAQQNYHIGNFAYNFEKIKTAIAQAKANNADIVVFSELAVCGYPPRDFLEFKDFIQRCENTIEKIRLETENIAVVVGSPSINPVIEGKDLFNSAYFIADKKIKHIAHKALLPTYDIFDEYRYFEPADSFEIVEYKGKKIAITICEDIWNVGNKNPMYTVCPMDILIKQKPDFMLNLSASPFQYAQSKERLHIVRTNVERYKIPIFYVNNTGGQTELLFDGGSIVMNGEGDLIEELPYFEEAFRCYELEKVMQPTAEMNINQEQTKDKIDLIHRALLTGISDYFGKLGFKKAIVGSSGGIDSAVVLALAAEALGEKNVHAVLMPSQFSSDHSVADAIKLSENLNCSYDIIPIKNTFEAFETSLATPFEGTEFDVTEENIQARIRGTILMAMSNKFGYILLNTSNKSEAAVGYGTLYGDMCGGLSVIGDVYKTETYELARYLNRNREIIPINIIEKAPSAELRPDQKDSDSLPDYDILDEILYLYIEKRKGPKELIALGFEQKLVDRILKLVNRCEYKRYQTPPMLRVSPKAFGMGRRMPIVGKYLS